MTITYRIIEKGIPTENFINIESSKGFYPGCLFKTLVSLGYDTEEKMDSIYLAKASQNFYNLKSCAALEENI